jgi:nucleoside-diphosphate-sugar epimerase
VTAAGADGAGTLNWNGRKTLVTGGTSFIGSHLVDALLDRGAEVRIVDDLSSGRLEYVQPAIDAGRVEFLLGNLLDQEVARRSVDGVEVVFHLAADHGGRGYVDLHQAACATNLTLDGNLFLAARQADVERLVYASSGCVYPNFRQEDPNETLYLTEDMVGPPFDADNMYGWAKLMGEMTLKSYAQEWGMRTASLRYFTVYGERGKEDHAVIAMIARAFVKQDPFVVWGTGEQVRNWTYVGDIVSGTILTAERVEDGTALNLGTMERTRVIDAVKEVMAYTGHSAEIQLAPDMPTGPMNRVADNSLARRLLEWEPEVPFVEGLHRTIDWYFASKDRAKVAANLEHTLTER